MTTVPSKEFQQLAELAQGTTAKVAENQPFTFLSLAPATSTSYPQTRNPQRTESLPPTPPEAVAETPKLEVANLDQMKRRTSSLSSDGAKSPTGLRFLKLGPVHWGEHPGDHKSDWHDVAVE